MEDRTGQVRELLERLVRIRSVNPPGDELPVARLLADQWSAAGFEVRLDEFAPGRANLVGRRRWGPGPSLLLNGHMDVQPPGHGWTHDPFAADVVGDRLYGQGAEDMKAGLAAATVAATNHAHRGPRQGELVLTAVADELNGGEQGTKRLVTQRLTADGAIVCEPTGSELYVAHRGALWLRLHVLGRSAHGGRPWQGQNAIDVMVDWLSALRRWAPADLRRTVHALLPDNTINIGTIGGGHKINIVADSCTADVDVRFLPSQDVESLVLEVRALGALVGAGTELTAEVIRVVEPMETDVRNPLVAVCQDAYRKVVGTDVRIGATAGFQDAHYLANDLHIPTVMFGPFAGSVPGDDYPTRSGQPDESVSLSALATTTAVYEELIDRALAPGGVSGEDGT